MEADSLSGSFLCHITLPGAPCRAGRQWPVLVSGARFGDNIDKLKSMSLRRSRRSPWYVLPRLCPSRKKTLVFPSFRLWKLFPRASMAARAPDTERRIPITTRASDLLRISFRRLLDKIPTWVSLASRGRSSQPKDSEPAQSYLSHYLWAAVTSWLKIL